MTTLTPVAQALQQVLDGISGEWASESLPLAQCDGRVLSEAITSPLDVPASDNSAMDGYALRADQATQPLPISQRVAAGQWPEPLAPDSAARIFTGAPVPPGADAVVMQEDCEVRDGLLTINADVSVGDNIRPRGQDIAKGATVLAAGRRLRPQDLGLLASLGLSTAPVAKALRVTVLSTGDELREPGDGLAHGGQLYNSNRYTLGGLLRGLGCEVIDGGIVADDADVTARALRTAAQQSDLVITSGGVSVGEEDHVKHTVESLGALTLWKLAMKPGKPLAFGHLGGTPFFGLPGNPVSVFVTFCLVVRPWILRRLGVADVEPLAVPAVAGFDFPRAGTRQEYLRVTVELENGELVAQRFRTQSSGVLSSLSASNALVIVPPGETFAQGDRVQVILLDELAGP